MADFTIKRGNRSPSLAATLDVSAGSLSGCTVRFLMRAQLTGLIKIDADAVIVDANARTVRYDWALGDTDTVGHFDAEWEVTYPGGSPLTATFPSYAHHDIAVVQNIE